MKGETAGNPSWPPPAGHPKGELLSTGFVFVLLCVFFLCFSPCFPPQNNQTINTSTVAGDTPKGNNNNKNRKNKQKQSIKTSPAGRRYPKWQQQ
jgi:hypothetical protein